MGLVHGGLGGAFDQNLVDADVRRARSHPDHGLGDVFRHQWIEAFVHFVGFRLVALETDHGKLRLR